MSRNQAVRPKTSGEHIDLAGAVIPYSDLSDTNLTSANFDGTNLSHADLSGTDLSGASLVGAVLTHADLSNTNLSHANLSRAKLAGADLTGANLTGAELDQADLWNAKMQGASLGHANNVSWYQLLDAYIDEETMLPEELGIEALHEAVEVIFAGFDLRTEFREDFDDGANFLSKLIELAGEKTIKELAKMLLQARIHKELHGGLDGEQNSAGLNEEPGEYKDE